MGLATNMWILCVVIATATLSAMEAKLIDLSHDQGFDTIMSPNNPKYRAENIFEGTVGAGVYAKYNKYSLGEHGGTHMDAPTHFHKDGRSLDQIPLEDTIADGVMIDCSKETNANSLYSMPLQKLKDWEEENGQIPMKAAVVANFNWSHRFNDSKKYFNYDTLENPASYKFPYVSAEAIDWLVNERDIKILAVDTASPDLIKGNLPVHVKLLTNNKLIVENIRDPSRLPARGFRFHAPPVKFVKATGSQVRAFAVLNESEGNRGSRQSVGAAVLLGCAVFVFFAKWTVVN